MNNSIELMTAVNPEETMEVRFAQLQKMRDFNPGDIGCMTPPERDRMIEHYEWAHEYSKNLLMNAMELFEHAETSAEQVSELKELHQQVISSESIFKISYERLKEREGFATQYIRGLISQNAYHLVRLTEGIDFMTSASASPLEELATHTHFDLFDEGLTDDVYSQQIFSEEFVQEVLEGDYPRVTSALVNATLMEAFISIAPHLGESYRNDRKMNMLVHLIEGTYRQSTAGDAMHA